MAKDVQDGLVPAVKIAQEAAIKLAPNGVRYATYGENNLVAADLERMVQAVPATIAAALGRKVYYFVPLAMSGGPDRLEREHRGGNDETMIAAAYSLELSERAICHRNVTLSGNDGGKEGGKEGVFISTRLLNDRFALAFEFFINVGHAFVEVAGVPESFNHLAWEQAVKDVRGETSQDAWESRGQSLIEARSVGPTSSPVAEHTGSRPRIDEKAKSDFLESAFSDAVAIYQLSLSVDFDYSELREREYPLLAPQPLAERLRLAAKLFPPNPGYEFSIRYRRRA